MTLEIAGIGGIILLVLVVWAIVNIIGSNAGTGSKVIWTVFVLLLPILGFLVWLIVGPRSASRQT